MPKIVETLITKVYHLHQLGIDAPVRVFLLSNIIFPVTNVFFKIKTEILLYDFTVLISAVRSRG